jgi:uncharacterized protein
MRGGHRVFDSDTHLTIAAECVEPYFGPMLRERLPELAQGKRPWRISDAGAKLSPPFRHRYGFRQRRGWQLTTRVLGEAEPRSEPRAFQRFMGRVMPRTDTYENVDARIEEMDREGIDVQLIVPNEANGHEDASIEMEFLRAEHRFLHDFCGKYPRRLKSLVRVTPRALAESIEEMEKWSRAGWAVGIFPQLPIDYPLDHPDLDPLWRAAADHGMAIVHHSFAEGYPGYRDLWSNPFIGRLCAHPWAAMRAVASFFGAGIMDRYPVRFGILESGFSWLPFWVRRMNDQAEYMGYVAKDLGHKVGDYATSGRFFAGIVLHEGEEMVRTVMDDLGDQILVFGSDYPHAESRFPDSVDIVLSWKSLSSERIQRLLWDNPVRFFGEP